MWRLPRKPMKEVARNKLRIHLFKEHGQKISRWDLDEILPPLIELEEPFTPL